MLFELSLNDLHTLATSLGYSIENLRREVKNIESGVAVIHYKSICRKDAEKLLRLFNEAIEHSWDS